VPISSPPGIPGEGGERIDGKKTPRKTNTSKKKVPSLPHRGKRGRNLCLVLREEIRFHQHWKKQGIGGGGGRERHYRAFIIGGENRGRHLSDRKKEGHHSLHPVSKRNVEQGKETRLGAKKKDFFHREAVSNSRKKKISRELQGLSREKGGGSPFFIFCERRGIIATFHRDRKGRGKVVIRKRTERGKG